MTIQNMFGRLQLHEVNYNYVQFIVNKKTETETDYFAVFKETSRFKDK